MSGKVSSSIRSYIKRECKKQGVAYSKRLYRHVKRIYNATPRNQRATATLTLVFNK